MSRIEELQALEARVPWERSDFRAGIGLLSSSVVAEARQFGADVRVLGELIKMVPRCAGDESGGTPWTSFRHEVAVARKISDQAAGRLIRQAQRLTTVLPQTLDLLEAGAVTAQRARVFIDELESLEDEVARQLDTDLGDKVPRLSPSQIKQEVRRAALALDAEVAARRAAAATAERGASYRAEQDGQASVLITGPAVPVTRWYTALDQQARALRQAGDARTLDQLRFDLACSTLPCFAHPPAPPAAYEGVPPIFGAAPPAPAPAPAAPAQPAAPAAASPFTAAPAPASPFNAAPAAAAGLRLTGVEAASTDCRLGRPVQAMVVLPVETSLGLSNEPAWLDGYGWIDAPTARLLLVDAELRRVCAQSGTGQLVDMAERDVRPPPTPEGIRAALLEMVHADIELCDIAYRTESQHDPSDPLRQFVALRDRSCDGPTGSQISARRADLDHGIAYPEGPTAAWNLVARGQRIHQLKHYGWTPLRTPTSTIWTSPAGQVVEVPHQLAPPPGIDPDAGGLDPYLPDPHVLAGIDQQLLTPSRPEDTPPWLPPEERLPDTDWTCLDDEPAPF